MIGRTASAAMKPAREARELILTAARCGCGARLAPLSVPINDCFWWCSKCRLIEEPGVVTMFLDFTVAA